MIQPGGRATAHVSGEGSPLALVSILAPLLLVWVVIDHFTIESKAFSRLALLTVAGFAVHYVLPLRYRLAFFAVLSMFGWMGVARLIRGEVLSLREREFVQAARVIGMPTGRILVKELLPNLVAPIVISVSLMLPAYVAAEAGLAYLGIGVTSGISWGQTINNTVPHFETYPLYLWEPVVGIVALVLALNLLGDAVRDALDPKTRR